MKRLIMSLFIVGALTSCVGSNSSDSVSGTTQPTMQAGGSEISFNNERYAIYYTASNCKNLSKNQDCNIDLTYEAPDNANAKLQYTTIPAGINLGGLFSACAAPSTTQNTCSIQIKPTDLNGAAITLKIGFQSSFGFGLGEPYNDYLANIYLK